MKISELNAEYDKLQLQYGAKELTSIYNGGCTDNPDICFVFMNPTGKNIASNPNWKGRRSPWIGTKNIWKLFYRIGLLDEKIYNEVKEFLGYSTCTPNQILDLKPDYVIISTKFYINIFEYLNEELLKGSKIKIKPLVKKSFITLIKEVWGL